MELQTWSFIQCEWFCSILQPAKTHFPHPQRAQKRYSKHLIFHLFHSPYCTDAQRRHASLAAGLKPFRHKVMKTCVTDLLNDVLLA